MAPAKSFKASFTDAMKAGAVEKFAAMGLSVSFGKYVNEANEFESTTVEHRLEDLHGAFADSNVKAILTVLGGSTSNQLLKHLNYDLIQRNPKILCGLSDITALANAIYRRTGVVTYSGPHFTLFGAANAVDYTVEYFKKCLLTDEPFRVVPSRAYCDKRWDSKELENGGYWIVNRGTARGRVLGGNLLTFKYLQGTDFAPGFKGSVLFLEDNAKESFRGFENQLQALINQSDFAGVKGLVIGRFQTGSGMTRELLTTIVRTKRELDNLPVLANADFGHTTPTITFPIGGEVELSVGDEAQLTIAKH